LILIETAILVGKVDCFFKGIPRFRCPRSRRIFISSVLTSDSQIRRTKSKLHRRGGRIKFRRFLQYDMGLFEPLLSEEFNRIVEELLAALTLPARVGWRSLPVTSPK